MKSLERMIKTMKDDLKDSYMLLEYAKEAKHDGNKDECDMYLSRAKARMEMWDKDITNINNMTKEWEHELMKDMTDKEKEAVNKVKDVYMKFYHHDMKHGEELKKSISDYRSSY